MAGIEAMRPLAIRIERYALPVAIVLALLSAPILCTLYLAVPASPDQAQFDYMGWLGTQGLSYYRDAFDHNWPGAMIYHEIAVRLFGVESWSFRLLDFLVLGAVTAGGALLLRRSGLMLGAALFLLLYPPIYVTAGFWMAGQRDIVGAGLLVIAAGLALPAVQDRARGNLDAILAGVLIGGAVLLRPTYLAYGAGLAALVMLPLVESRFSARLARAVAILVGIALTLGLAAAWALQAGTLAAWWEQAVLFNLTSYGNDGPRLRLRRVLWFQLSRSWHWIGVTGLVGLAIWGWCAWRGRGAMRFGCLASAGVAAAVLLSFFAQNKGLFYHLGGMLPASMLMIAAGIDRLAAGAVAQSTTLVRAATLVALLMLAGTAAAGTIAKLRYLAPAGAAVLSDGRWRAPALGERNVLENTTLDEMLERMAEPGAPKGTLLIFGREYELAFLAERLPATRFLSIQAFLAIDAESTLGQRWHDEFRATLRAEPPAFIFIARSFLDQPEPRRPLTAHVMGLVASGRYETIVEAREGILARRADP
ncbi:MAG: hypothetical protein AAF565_01065 [Pseudomonadota bacterium]